MFALSKQPSVFELMSGLGASITRHKGSIVQTTGEMLRLMVLLSLELRTQFD